MDCREARKKLSQLADNLLETQEEAALREHLGQCHKCARLAAAETVLVQDLEQMREYQSPRPVSIEQVCQGIALREKRYRNTNLGVRIMRQVEDTVYSRPRLSLAAAAIMMLLVASVLVPVSTDRSVGYEVAFAAPAGGFVLNQENAERVLAALDIEDARIESSEADSGVVYTISELKDSAQVRRLIAALDSLGGRHVQGLVKEDESGHKTIWQLLLKEEGSGSSSSSARGKKRAVTLNLKKMFPDNVVLWVPLGDQTDDSLRGMLLERSGEKNNIQFVGMPTGSPTNPCGMNWALNGYSQLRTTMPDGEKVDLDLSNIDNVRKLESAGYNFASMKFETPMQIPIPGMGLKLGRINPNPFRNKTVIEYLVPQAYKVEVQILDQRGALVRSLADCIAVAGVREIVWDGLDDNEEPVSPGTYQCRFAAGDYSETKQITLER